MKKTMKLLALLTAAILLLAAFGCKAQPAQKDTGITVVDMTGREVKLEKPAERIVALTAADCVPVSGRCSASGSRTSGCGERWLSACWSQRPWCLFLS